MAQKIESPIAPVRTGYKVGDEVEMSGRKFRVVGARPDGSPILDLTPQSPVKTAPLLEKVWSKREQIMSLPDGVREQVIDRLFDKAMAPQIPKSIDEKGRALIKQRFYDRLSGKDPTPDPGQDPEELARAGNVPHGAFGVARAGLMEGLANMLGAIRKEGAKLHYGSKGPPRSMEDLITGNDPMAHYADKGLVYGAEQWLRREAGEQRQATMPYEARSKQHSFLGIPFTRADLESGAGKTLSSLPLDLATMELIPGAKGAKLASRVVSGAGKGAVGGAVTAPSFGQDMTTGAAYGATLGGLFGLVPRLRKPGGAVASKPTIAGIEDLQKISQGKFQKAFEDLNPQQKMDAIDAWKAASAKETAAKAAAAKKTVVEQKVEAVKAQAEAKVREKIEVRKAMDEAKALQKRIAEFVKTNKRAPNEQELGELRKGVVLKTEERGPKIPERRTFLRTEDPDVKLYYRYRFDQIRDEIAKATTPEEKAAAERRLQQMMEVQKAHPTTKGDVQEAFKVENPQVIKAVQAVADVSKATDVVKIPEGASGLSPEKQVLNEKLDAALEHLTSATDPKVKAQVQKTVENIKAAIQGDEAAAQRIKDAERKATGRSEAAATAGAGEKSAATAAAPTLNPEQALEQMEERFYEITDALEAKGPNGKTLAKNLLKLWKNPPKGTTREMVIEGGERALEMMK